MDMGWKRMLRCFVYQDSTFLNNNTSKTLTWMGFEVVFRWRFALRNCTPYRTWWWWWETWEDRRGPRWRSSSSTKSTSSGWNWRQSMTSWYLSSKEGPSLWNVSLRIVNSGQNRAVGRFLTYLKSPKLYLRSSRAGITFCQLSRGNLISKSQN